MQAVTEAGIAIGGVMMLLCYAVTTALAFSGRMAQSSVIAGSQMVGQGTTLN